MIDYTKPELKYNIHSKNEITEDFKNIIRSIAEQNISSNFARENIIDNLKYLGFDDVVDKLYEYFSYEVIGICGCGSSDATIQDIVDYLNILDYWTTHVDDKDIDVVAVRERMMESSFTVSYTSDNPLLQFMAYILDDKNLTDHGSSINGAWITDFGRVCLYVYKVYLKYKCNNDQEETT